MQPEMIRQGFDAASSVVTTVAQELLVSRKEQKIIETKAEAEKRIAEMEAVGRENNGRLSGVSSETSADTSAEGSGRLAEQASGSLRSIDIDPLIEQETCSVCQRLLEAVAEMDPEKRAVGLAEYGEMKASIDDGASAPELKEYLQGTDVLSEALETIM